MSRLLNYLNKAKNNEEDLNRVKSSSIRLVEKIDTLTEDSLKKLQESNNELKKIDKIVKSLNKELKNYYTGKKYQFSLTTESSDSLEKIKLSENQKSKIKKKFLELNSELAKIQIDL